MANKEYKGRIGGEVLNEAPTPTTNLQVANKAYVDANGGSGSGSSIPVSKTGSNIVFTSDALYNEQNYLTTGNLVLDLTGAVKGALSIVYCDRYIPTISGEDYLISGNMSTSKLNELWFFWNGTAIELMIINKSYIPAISNVTIVPFTEEIVLSGFQTLNANSYEILFSTTNDINTASAVPNYNGTDTSYTHTGLTPEVTYYYWLRGFGLGYLPSVYYATSAATIGSNFNTTSLSAAYEADELSGTVSTDAFGTKHGTLSNIVLGGTGKINTSYKFNGSSSFINYSALNNEFTGSFTVMLWIKTTTAGTTYRFFQNRGTGAAGSVKGFVLSFEGAGHYGGTIIDNGAGASVKFDDILTIGQRDGLWHQLGLIFDTSTGTAKLGIDGVIVSTKTNAALAGVDYTALDVLAGKSNQNTQYFPGDMDLIRVWKRPITDTEFADHYNNGNGLAI